MNFSELSFYKTFFENTNKSFIIDKIDWMYLCVLLQL